MEDRLSSNDARELLTRGLKSMKLKRNCSAQKNEKSD